MPLISYNNNIPNPPNNPSADVSLMQQNTNSIDQIIAVDHFSFNVGTNNSGTHKQVTLTNEAPPGFAGGDSVIFANLQGGLSVPWVQNASFTLPLMSHVVPVSNVDGYTSILGAIVLQWGRVLNPGTSGIVNFNIPFPNNVYNVQLSLQRSKDENDIAVVKKMYGLQ